MTYEELLKKAPNSRSVGLFNDYLRDNNRVVFETPNWIVIENFKYHHRLGNKAWWTAFYKRHARLFNELEHSWEIEELTNIIPRTWEVRVKREQDRSVERFHIHLIE